MIIVHTPVAQRIARLIPVQKAAGSIPVGRAKRKFKDLRSFFFFFVVYVTLNFQKAELALHTIKLRLEKNR